MMAVKLRLLDTEEPPAASLDARKLDAIAEIEQSMREWSGPCGRTDGWKPVEVDATKPLPVDDVQRRSYKVIVVNSPIPFWRKVMRWLKQ